MFEHTHPETPSSFSSSPDSPLVLGEFAERCMGNMSIATLLLDKFEKQMQGDLATIETCLRSKDSDQIARVAHALKGAAAAVAAPSLRDIAAELESMARLDDLHAATDRFAALRNEIGRCIRYLPEARGALVNLKAARGKGTS